MVDGKIARIAHRSGSLGRLAGLVMATVVAALLWETGVVLRHAARPEAVLEYLIYRLPAILYVTALWSVRAAFRSLATGLFFEQVVPQLLARVGWFVSAGATAAVFGIPLLLRLVPGSSHSAFANFDLSAITLGLIGFMLVVLARLFARAATIQAELDEFL